VPLCRPSPFVATFIDYSTPGGSVTGGGVAARDGRQIPRRENERPDCDFLLMPRIICAIHGEDCVVISFFIEGPPCK
jgi:hypothetical protein